MREMGGGESNESSPKFGMRLFRRSGDERRRRRRRRRVLRGRKNKQVAFLIGESLEERAGGAAEVKAKLSHFFTPISCDPGHSGSRHRMELCVRLCDPSSAVLPYGTCALMVRESVEHEGFCSHRFRHIRKASQCVTLTLFVLANVLLYDTFQSAFGCSGIMTRPLLKLGQ